jgi:hypothetical protein
MLFRQQNAWCHLLCRRAYKEEENYVMCVVMSHRAFNADAKK